MTDLQRYLVEEIALDHADGLITRREALRRLGLVGIGVTAASSLLAAVLAQQARAGRAGGVREHQPDAQRVDSASVPTKMITFPGPAGRKLIGAWAAARQPRGGVLVIHENRGLTPHIRSVAGRFAAGGYSALAIDLLSEEGGTSHFQDEAAAMAALYGVPTDRFAADMKAGVTELGRRVPGKKLAATGFCFGGGMVWLLLASKEPRLAAAAPFYGPFPDGSSLKGSKAAVLGIYAGLDDRVNSTRTAARAALRAAGLKHELVTLPGVDHAFFNDTGGRYDRAAAAEAYRRVLAWFRLYVDPKK
ncbi:MAG TPA: dienelactone hydrolase family protein [Gaiellaceae bacterium]|nr:dienelactone hydrolase family protein [Gaiellaceae bacterium]